VKPKLGPKVPSPREKWKGLEYTAGTPPIKVSVHADIFRDMFVYQSGLGREQGTQNETSTPQDPKQVPKPKDKS
jgi:hypothetical protein